MTQQTPNLNIRFRALSMFQSKVSTSTTTLLVYFRISPRIQSIIPPVDQVHPAPTLSRPEIAFCLGEAEKNQAVSVVLLISVRTYTRNSVPTLAG
jgi:hypothetical protein